MIFSSSQTAFICLTILILSSPCMLFNCEHNITDSHWSVKLFYNNEFTLPCCFYFLPFTFLLKCSTLFCLQLVSEVEIHCLLQWFNPQLERFSLLHSDNYQIPSLISASLVWLWLRKTVWCYFCRHCRAEPQPNEDRPVTRGVSPGCRRRHIKALGRYPWALELDGCFALCLHRQHKMIVVMCKPLVLGLVVACIRMVWCLFCFDSTKHGLVIVCTHPIFFVLMNL